MKNICLICVMLFFLVGCGGASDFSEKGHGERKSSGNTISVTEAWELLRDKKLIVVDVRTPAEWRSTGTPKGAVRLSFQAHPQGIDGFINDLDKALGDDRESAFAIICRTGSRTRRLAAYLREKGFSGVIDIPEGMAGSAQGRGWIRSDLPLD